MLLPPLRVGRACGHMLARVHIATGDIVHVHVDYVYPLTVPTSLLLVVSLLSLVCRPSARLISIFLRVFVYRVSLGTVTFYHIW